ncbi:phosphatase PAP2 family protein [Oceanobacillus neutriphilus]|uniref:Phosphatase PAP2 family protein n=1 Tax=Oceanobacillus neutriphilus TaxID=531815 RepID=A0ABQ2NSM1_9BACI|nr:phosphatase PAP2 family protein [Oceanobacillus neutriphilus]GGP09587.1 phosphatase PAP2 family protein [Oceanobacillus neutriphilus]
MKNKFAAILFSIWTAGFLLSIGWVIQIKMEMLPYTDQWTRSIVTLVHGTGTYDFFRMVTELGSSHVLIPIAIAAAIGIMFLYKHWYPGLLLLGGSLFAHLLNSFIKQLVSRERPSISVALNAEGFSFPSGHSTISMVCYGLIAYLLCKKIRSQKIALIVQIGLGTLVFLIGISRFFINVHYLTDIIAGFTLGFALLYLYICIGRTISDLRRRRKHS